MPEERIEINGEEFIRIARTGVPEDHPDVSDKYYLHTQDTPSSVWEYEHGMGRRPAVRAYGTDGVEVEGDVTHPDVDTVRIEFGGSISGVATNS